MVNTQLENRDITNPAVLEVMRKVPREKFVPEQFEEIAYRDGALPIGHDQTISQPYIVASMTQALDPQPEDKVLEIGTGSGYQAAILGKIVDQVYTIEIIEELASTATDRLERLGYDNVTVKHGNGYEGWSEHAPFDKIIVTAAPPEMPDQLVEQLAEGGRMIVPVGEHRQSLKVLDKKEDGDIQTSGLMDVQFVPMVREEEDAK
jgi:protein-L-isoaspartate(D-aspartate) O-methyltransferase